VHDDVTAVVISLNGEDNIYQCLSSLVSLNLYKILLIDGGSSDNTIQIAKEFKNVEVRSIAKTGLSHSRQYGVDLVTTQYVLLADVDNILDKDCLNLMKPYLKENNFVGVAAGKFSAQKDNLFASFQEWMNNFGVNLLGEKMVIGTPALFSTQILKEVRYDTKIKMGDDTQLCYKLSKEGHKVGTSNAKCYEVMESTLEGFSKKAFLYGKADGEFFKSNPSRRLNIGTHALRNYFLKMSLRALLRFQFRFLILSMIYGALRFFGLLSQIMKFYKKP
jgi:glycosyltransferase involved in cell wall biosynthesis